MANNTEFERAYNSFSGVDMKAMVGQQVLGSMQAFSYSVTREKAPLYTCGSADPRSFSRGKRAIAGTLVFLVFDRHPLLGTDNAFANDLVLLDKEELNASFTGSSKDLTFSFGDPDYFGEPVQTAESSVSQVGEDQVWGHPTQVDQITPTDIVLVASNEYGYQMKMVVGGIEFLNEGSGFSIDDIVTEQQMTYVARGIVPWTPVPPPKKPPVIAGPAAY